MTAHSASQIIAIDAMSGDGGAAVSVDAVALFLKKHADTELALVGNKSELQKHIAALPVAKKKLVARCTIVEASEVVEMEDSTRVALKNKKDSSMRVAINSVKTGQAGACVSAGNTGALLAISKFVLKTLPGIARPAICTTLPSLSGHTHMLDLGANVDCTSEHLFQFAVMGAELASAVDSNASPSVGLLNIGSEDVKGNEQVKDAAQLLEQLQDQVNFNYVGFVEGDEIYTGDCNVIVCDGFVGNVSLKSSEGVARMIRQFMREEFLSGPFSKLAGLMARPVLKSFSRRIDPRRYNGASLLGLQGVVIKSHGGADALAFSNAINIARLEIEKNVPARIGQQIASQLHRAGDDEKPAKDSNNKSHNQSADNGAGQAANIP